MNGVLPLKMEKLKPKTLFGKDIVEENMLGMVNGLFTEIIWLMNGLFLIKKITIWLLL
jgi:hypothetical protein